MIFDILAVSEVRIGAPKVTPNAYRETVKPAVVTGIFKSLAINGNNPTLINSVVPIANALTAKASSANVLLFYLNPFFLLLIVFSCFWQTIYKMCGFGQPANVIMGYS